MTRTSIARTLAGSYVVWALTGLVFLDVAFRLSQSLRTEERYNSPNRSWVWWAVRDFRSQKDPPDVVLLGSSLMMAALHGGDATYTGQPQNVAFHHRSRLMEDLLEKHTRARLRSFAFALGGQMASDAYALSAALITRGNPPGAIVYGIAPRDFMDNTLSSPASTETFRYMGRIGGLEDVGWSARSSFWEKVEYALEQVSLFYRHRPDFVHLQQHCVQAVLRHGLGMRDLDEVHTPFPVRKQALLELPEDCGPNDLMILPYRKEDHKFENNLDEYRMRYRTFKPKIFQTQISYLERMLKLCRERGIAVYLVNMPLTPENVQLMPPGLYDNYMSTVANLARQYGAQMVDLNDPAVFTHEYFADSVHMNGAGGVKFFEVLSAKLSGIDRVCARRAGAGGGM